MYLTSLLARRGWHRTIAVCYHFLFSLSLFSCVFLSSFCRLCTRARGPAVHNVPFVSSLVSCPFDSSTIPILSAFHTFCHSFLRQSPLVATSLATERY